MKSLANMHWMRIVVALILAGLASSLFAYQNTAIDYMRQIFESKSLQAGLWIYVLVAVITKRIFGSNGGKSIFEDWTKLIFDILGYGAAGSSSLTLLKGTFMQLYFKAEVFPDFNLIDLGCIVLVSSYLLIWSFNDTTKMFIEVFIKAAGTDIDTAIKH